MLFLVTGYMGVHFKQTLEKKGCDIKKKHTNERKIWYSDDIKGKDTKYLEFLPIGSKTPWGNAG